MSVATANCFIEENTNELSVFTKGKRSLGAIELPEQLLAKQRRQKERGDLYWIELTLAGNNKGFDMLVHKYQGRIYRLVQSLVPDFDTAKDVVQETFIRAFKALRNYRRESQFYTWLYRIALNTSYNHLKTTRNWHTKTESLDEELSEVHEVDHMGPERVRENEDLKQGIQIAVSQLPMDLRSALVLRELEGFSYEQISEIVGCELGTVKSRISRARERVMAKTAHLYERT